MTEDAQTAPRPASAFAPFRHRIFLSIWLASLVSNFGSLIQGVGASWLMTSIAPSADMVALVQASTSLPIMLLSLPAGALADAFDRRHVMLAAQVLMFAVSATLAAVSFAGLITPWLLLFLTFLIGCGAALNGPAWQASVGEQVPMDDVPAAVALNSVGFNIARTVGPAIGGVLVAAAGPPFAFLVNACTYVGLVAVLLLWKRPQAPRDLPPERLFAGMRSGLSYALWSPAIRTVLIRSFAFSVGSAAIWALMPLIARDLIGGGPLVYGLLLGAFGTGAILGALLSTRLRRTMSIERLVLGASLAFAAATAAAAVSHLLIMTAPALVIAGAAWVLALSTFNVTVQMSSSRWVVGRAMAAYQSVTFGALALGSWAWGTLAHYATLTTALLCASAVLAVSLALSRVARLPQQDRPDLTPSRAWPEPALDIEIDPATGPIVVSIEYRIAVSDAETFRLAMTTLRQIRRRDGARGWTLLQDIAEPERWIERFHSSTWLDHLRHHRRVTVSDRAVEMQVTALHKGPAPPVVRHLLMRRPDD